MADVKSSKPSLTWRPLWELALTAVVTFVIGIVAVFDLLKQIVRKGPSRVFYVSPRHAKPAVLEKFGTHQYLTLKESGVKLHYVVNGQPDKPLIVFIHGFPEFWYSWRHQLQYFKRDFRTVAYDLRGYGESDRPTDISGYTMEQMASDLDQLIAGLGYERAVVVGHDWGGAAAWSLAVLYPHRIDKLVIINAPHPAPFFAYMRQHPSQVRKLWHMLLIQIPILSRLMIQADDYHWPTDCFRCKPMGAKPGTFTEDDIDAFKYTFYNYGDWSACFRMFRAAFRYINPRLEGLSENEKIRVPTIIIWGTDDGAIETELAELSAKYVEQCTVKYIDGASHWVQQEEPETVNRLIQEFINKQ